MVCTDFVYYWALFVMVNAGIILDVVTKEIYKCQTILIYNKCSSKKHKSVQYGLTYHSQKRFVLKLFHMCFPKCWTIPLSLYLLKCIYINAFLSLDLWEFYLPYLYSCISLMGGLLLLSKPFDHFLYTPKKQNVIAHVELECHQVAIAELIYLIMAKQSS